MKTPISGYVYKYRKAREDAESYRKRFGHPDEMESSRKKEYEEILRRAASNITRLKMHLGREGINFIEREESVEDLKDLMVGRTRVDELIDEYNDKKASLGAQNEKIKESFDYIEGIELKQFLLDLMREDFYTNDLRGGDFDPDTMWEIFDEAHILTTDSFIDRKTKLTPILARKSPGSTLKSYVQLVSSLFLLGQWAAAIVFCRSILDDILDKVHQDDDELGRFKKESLHDYFERVFHAKCGPEVGKRDSNEEFEVEEVKTVIKRGNDLLHGSEDVSQPTEEECLECIKLVFKVAEMLIDRI